MATTQKKKRSVPVSDYAAKNKSRQDAWEAGFRARIEAFILDNGGVGQILAASGLRQQTLAKIRKGGSRAALLARLFESTNLHPVWLFLGTGSRYLSGRSGLASYRADGEVAQIASSSRRDMPAKAPVRKQNAKRR